MTMNAITKDTPCFFTQQPFLIGTYDPDGAPRFAPISWVSYTFGPPGCLVISMYGQKRTRLNAERTGRLTATLVTPELLPLCEHFNAATWRTEQHPEWRAVPAQEVEAPLLANGGFSYELKVLQRVEIGDCATFFAEIARVNVPEEIQRMEFFDLRQINPVVYSPDHYFTVGDHLGRIGDFAGQGE